MAWVRFTDDYNYRKPAFTIAYRKGMTLNVPSEAATLAIAEGRAVRMHKASKDEEPVPVDDDVKIKLEYDIGTVRRQLQELQSKDEEPTEWQQPQSDQPTPVSFEIAST